MPLFDKLLDRVRGRPGANTDPSQQGKQLTVGTPASADDKDMGPGVDEAPSPGLLARVRDKVLSLFSPGERDQLNKRKKDSLPAQRGDLDGMMLRIRRAALTKTKLLFNYNGVWRLIEPYSFRRKQSGGEPRFFLWCLLHDNWHGVYLSRCGGVMNTDEPFTERALPDGKGVAKIEIR